MIQRYNREMSFSFYIAALAVSDTITLLIGMYKDNKTELLKVFKIP